MKHLFSLAKYFFKKNIKPIISFSIILLIATVMFTSGLTISTTIDSYYDKKFNDLNTANDIFTIPSIYYSNELLNNINNLDYIEDTEVITGIYLTIPVDMNGTHQDLNQIFYNMDEIKNISKYNIYLDTNEYLDKPIYIPYYIYANGSTSLKDKFTFKIDNIDYSFHVKGIIEEMQYGNYSSSVIGQYLPNESYNYLLKNNSQNEVKTILIKSNNSSAALNKASKLLTKKNIPILNKGYDNPKKQARLSVSNIIVLILLVFSLIILLISLLVTKFKIKQTIEEDITNMGVLKSLGYKSKEIIVGMIIPYLITTLLISSLGVILSIPIINILGNVISSQAGFIWSPKLNIIVSMITIILNILLIILFSYNSLRKIKKLNPIEAIRGLSKNTNTKNYFEIEKTKGNINVILALKNFANNISSNILLGIVLFFITILASFVIALFYNVNVNPMNFINTLVEEHPTIMIKQKEDIKENIKNMKEVKEVIYYDDTKEITLKDNSYKTFIAESYKTLANDLVYEGRNPENSNEVAIGSSIKEQFNYKIGDKIKLSKNGIFNTYEIVGFVQSVNYSGEIIEITLDGYKKLEENYIPEYLYIYTHDETEENASILVDKINNNYNKKIDSMINYVESMNSATSMFINLIEIITIVIIAITLTIIYLILNILISGIIQNKKQELGVLKSIGYKTNSLVFQIIGGLTPSTFIFVILALVVSKTLMKNIFNFIFKMVGAYKVSFTYPLFIFIGCSIFIIISTILIGILLCKKIKKITVYSLIKD